MKTIEVFDDLNSQYGQRLEDNVVAVKLRMTSTISRLVSILFILAVTIFVTVLTGLCLYERGLKGWANLVFFVPLVLSLAVVILGLRHMCERESSEKSQMSAWGEVAFDLLVPGATDTGAKLRLKKIAHEIQCLETFNPDHPQLESMRNRCRTIHWILSKAGMVSMTYESLFPKES